MMYLCQRTRVLGGACSILTRFNGFVGSGNKAY